jgi:hypothetical protein
MKISLNLLENSNEISQKILNALLTDVNKYMEKSINIVKQELPKIIYSAIISSPEYSSIIGGKLRFDFGIVDGPAKIEGLLQIWTNNIDIQYDPPKIKNNQIISTFSISMIKADYSDVLGTEYANIIDNARGYSLPWLHWLLLDGTKILVDNHQVIVAPNTRSRTGMALMGSGSGWSVPSEFAGTQNDNWITRAIDSSSENIDKLLKKAFNI